MTTLVHHAPESFHERALPFLMSDEAKNNLMLGITAALVAGREIGPAHPYLVTAERDGEIIAAAIMTPPFNLIVTRTEEKVLAIIADDLIANRHSIPGVVGPVPSTNIFALLWSARTLRPVIASISQRLYELDTVIAPANVPGALRTARPDDIDLLTAWSRRFWDDVGITMPQEQLLARTTHAVDLGEIVLWEDRGPVSMAGWSGTTANGARINRVYTPNELRGRGYASACVAALSRQLRDAGRRNCYLFTDLSNPTSNGIYQNIGYRPVSDFVEHRF